MYGVLKQMKISTFIDGVLKVRLKSGRYHPHHIIYLFCLMTSEKQLKKYLIQIGVFEIQELVDQFLEDYLQNEHESFIRIMTEDYGVRNLTEEESATVSNLLKNIRNQKRKEDPLQELEKMAGHYITNSENRSRICLAWVEGKLDGSQPMNQALNGIVRPQKMIVVRKEYEKFKESEQMKEWMSLYRIEQAVNLEENRPQRSNKKKKADSGQDDNQTPTPKETAVIDKKRREISIEWQKYSQDKSEGLMFHILRAYLQKEKMTRQRLDAIVRREKLDRADTDMEHKLLLQINRSDKDKKSSIMGEIYDIKTTLYPISLSVTSRLLKKGLSSEFKETLASQGDKKIYFIYGNTGVGKTTMIQSLLGYSFRKKTIKKGAPTVLQRMTPLAAQHQNIEWSQFSSNSVTETISLYEVITENGESCRTFLADCPGSLDTNGPSFQLAHNIIMNHILKSLLSNRFSTPNKNYDQLSKMIRGSNRNAPRDSQIESLAPHGSTKTILIISKSPQSSNIKYLVINIGAVEDSRGQELKEKCMQISKMFRFNDFEDLDLLIRIIWARGTLENLVQIKSYVQDWIKEEKSHFQPNKELVGVYKWLLNQVEESIIYDPLNFPYHSQFLEKPICSNFSANFFNKIDPRLGKDLEITLSHMFSSIKAKLKYRSDSLPECRSRWESSKVEYQIMQQFSRLSSEEQALSKFSSLQEYIRVICRETFSQWKLILKQILDANITEEYKKNKEVYENLLKVLQNSFHQLYHQDGTEEVSEIVSWFHRQVSSLIERTDFTRESEPKLQQIITILCNFKEEMNQSLSLFKDKMALCLRECIKVTVGEFSPQTLHPINESLVKRKVILECERKMGTQTNRADVSMIEEGENQASEEMEIEEEVPHSAQTYEVVCHNIRTSYNHFIIKMDRLPDILTKATDEEQSAVSLESINKSYSIMELIKEKYQEIQEIVNAQKSLDNLVNLTRQFSDEWLQKMRSHMNVELESRQNPQQKVVELRAICSRLTKLSKIELISSYLKQKGKEIKDRTAQLQTVMNQKLHNKLSAVADNPLIPIRKFMSVPYPHSKMEMLTLMLGHPTKCYNSFFQPFNSKLEQLLSFSRHLSLSLLEKVTSLPDYGMLNEIAELLNFKEELEQDHFMNQIDEDFRPKFGAYLIKVKLALQKENHSIQLRRFQKAEVHRYLTNFLILTESNSLQQLSSYLKKQFTTQILDINTEISQLLELYHSQLSSLLGQQLSRTDVAILQKIWFTITELEDSQIAQEYLTRRSIETSTLPSLSQLIDNLMRIVQSRLQGIQQEIETRRPEQWNQLQEICFVCLSLDELLTSRLHYVNHNFKGLYDKIQQKQGKRMAKIDDFLQKIIQPDGNIQTFYLLKYIELVDGPQVLQKDAELQQIITEKIYYKTNRINKDISEALEQTGVESASSYKPIVTLVATFCEQIGTIMSITLQRYSSLQTTLLNQIKPRLERPFSDLLQHLKDKIRPSLDSFEVSEAKIYKNLVRRFEDSINQTKIIQKMPGQEDENYQSLIEERELTIEDIIENPQNHDESVQRKVYGHLKQGQKQLIHQKIKQTIEQNIKNYRQLTMPMVKNKDVRAIQQCYQDIESGMAKLSREESLSYSTQLNKIKQMYTQLRKKEQQEKIERMNLVELKLRLEQLQDEDDDAQCLGLCYEKYRARLSSIKSQYLQSDSIKTALQVLMELQGEEESEVADLVESLNIQVSQKCQIGAQILASRADKISQNIKYATISELVQAYLVFQKNKVYLTAHKGSLEKLRLFCQRLLGSIKQAQQVELRVKIQSIQTVNESQMRAVIRYFLQVSQFFKTVLEVFSREDTDQSSFFNELFLDERYTCYFTTESLLIYIEEKEQELLGFSLCDPHFLSTSQEITEDLKILVKWVNRWQQALLQYEIFSKQNTCVERRGKIEANILSSIRKTHETIKKEVYMMFDKLDFESPFIDKMLTAVNFFSINQSVFKQTPSPFLQFLSEPFRIELLPPVKQAAKVEQMALQVMRQVDGIKSKYDKQVSIQKQILKSKIIELEKQAEQRKGGLRLNDVNERQSEVRNIDTNLLTDKQHEQEAYDEFQVREWESAESKMTEVLFPWCKNLVNITKAQMVIPKLTETYQTLVNRSLNAFFQRSRAEKDPNRSIKFNMVIKILASEQLGDYGKVVIEGYGPFSSLKQQEFTRNTKLQDIDYVMKHLQLEINLNNQQFEDYQRQEIREVYLRYRQKYERIMNQYIKLAVPQKQDLFLKNLAKRAIQIYDDIQKLAIILAVWSIEKTFRDESNFTEEMYEPHPVQVTAVIVLFGLHEKKVGSDVTSKIGQVLTGEGKSIVLAVLAIMFALKGRRTSVACYSQYLVERDRQSFKFIMERFGVKDKIKYQTFNNVCQSVINPSDDLSFSNWIEKQLFQKKETEGIMNWVKKQGDKIFNFFISGRKEECDVLLIDQVDVFFDKRFDGQLYRPAIRLRQKCVVQLLQFIWQTCKTAPDPKLVTPKTIQQSQEYKRVVIELPSLEKLLENQLHGMLAAAKNWQHAYYTINGAISYEDHDGLSTRINYGYKTTFAYIENYSTNKPGNQVISPESYKEHVGITLVLHAFSYAKLPTYFKTILGLSGTVSCLTKPQKEHLQSLSINQLYYFPSIYGQQQRVKMTLESVETSVYHEALISHIKQKSEKENRPVLVFCKNYKSIQNIIQNLKFQSQFPKAQFLTLKNDKKMRDSIIKRTCMKSNVTLMEKQFARGTDIKQYDEALNKKGGLHAIVTFIPSTKEDLVQCKGRTGRQGKSGSFCVFVPETEFEKFETKLMHDEDAERFLMNLYDKNEQKAEDAQANRETAQKLHNQAVKFYKKKPDRQAIIEHLIQMNKQRTYSSTPKKLLIGLDGTCSMRTAFTAIKRSLSELVRRVQILKNTMNKQKEGLQIQISLYTNYNDQKILQHSGFYSQADGLVQFISSSNVQGGWGNQAVEVFLQYANSLEDPNLQVIIIGDMPGNTPEMVRSKRARKGDIFWNNQGLTITNTDLQVEKAIKKSIPIHSLYIVSKNSSTQTKDYFEMISTRTAGVHQRFKPHSKDAADQLTKFVTLRALQSIAGRENSEHIRQSYEQQFRSYV